MSNQKLFINLINALEERELYSFAKLYLKEVEGINNLVVSNGPYDSGIDLRKANEIEIQYQATVEKKNFEKKLEADLLKAKANVTNNNLPNKVQYFYSQNLSNSSIIEYKKDALKKFGLVLTLLDANILADITTHYDSLAYLLMELSDLPKYQTGNEFFDTTKARAFYDFMSFGKSTDIKFNIVQSYVLNYLCNKAVVSRDVLLNDINEHFSSKINRDYFGNFLAKLSSEKKIKIEGKNIEILEDEKSRIQSVLSNYKIEEALLIKNITEILGNNDINIDINEVIVKLSKIYESTYSINLGEFQNRESNFTSVEDATNDLVSLLKNNSSEDHDFKKITQTLVEIADKGEILSRIAAGQLYSNVSDPQRLQEYIWQNINNKNIFLDANVLIYLLLCHYNENIDYSEYHFKIAKQFINFSRENSLHLKTIRKYAIEVTNIFKEALQLVPFSKLKVFESLGVSSNMVYNFYIFLKDYEYLNSDIKNFEDFLKEFHFQPNVNLKSSMEYLLRSLQVEIEDIYDYELNRTIEIIQEEQRTARKTKSFSAIQNDAIMFNRLGDSDVDINPIDPIFCTWDLSLIPVRKRYFEVFSDCTKWFMFTPPRLLEHFAMMNFQVKPGTVSNEVLTILDQDYGFKQATQSLLDSLLIIINPNDEVGIKYTNKLGKLREEEVLEVDAKGDAGEVSAETTPTDKIFSSLIKNYLFFVDEQASKSFKALFTKEEFIDEVLEAIAKEKQYVVDFGDVSPEFIPKMDKILEKSQKAK